MQMTDSEIMEALTQPDKDWININVKEKILGKRKAHQLPIKEKKMEDKPYQITYMSGPINVTLRMDSKTNLVSDLEEIVDQARKSTVLNAKESVSSAPKQAVYTKDEVQATCTVHSVGMQQGLSKKTNKNYFYHDNAQGERCFGKGYQPKKY